MDNKRELLQNIFFEILMVINRHASPQWRYEERSLSYYNIMLIYEGEGEFIRNGEKHTVHRGDFIFYRSGDSRSISTNPDNLLKCYGINFRYVVPVFLNTEPFDRWELNSVDLPIDFVTKINNEHTLDRLLYLFDRLFRIHLLNTSLSKQEARKIFVDLLDLFFFSVYNKDINYSNKARTDHIIQYMTMHFQENITVADLAAQEHISVSYLVRIFKEITGQTPITYLNNIRMNKAKQLLADGCPVTAAALNVGFSDVYYFSRAFKKHVGITPSSYKSMSKSL